MWTTLWNKNVFNCFSGFSGSIIALCWRLAGTKALTQSVCKSICEKTYYLIYSIHVSPLPNFTRNPHLHLFHLPEFLRLAYQKKFFRRKLIWRRYNVSDGGKRLTDWIFSKCLLLMPSTKNEFSKLNVDALNLHNTIIRSGSLNFYL